MHLESDFPSYKWELWELSESGAIQFSFFPSSQDESRAHCIKNGGKKTWEIYAKNYDEAMQLYYDHQGWGMYKPF